MGLYIEGIEEPIAGQVIEIAEGIEGKIYARISPGFDYWHPVHYISAHGRLIDADALIKQVKRDGIQSDPFVRIVCDYFKDAPTIIPDSE